MGYDEDECIMLYFWGSVNDKTPNKDYLCSSCVEQCVAKYGCTPSLQFVLEHRVRVEEHRCFRCLKNKPITYHFSVKPGCAEQAAKDYAKEQQ
jgi:hypothetical protein